MRNRMHLVLSISVIALVALFVWRSQWLLGPAQHRLSQATPTLPAPPLPSAPQHRLSQDAATPLEVQCDCQELKEDMLAARRLATQSPTLAPTAQDQPTQQATPARPADIPRPTPAPAATPTAQATPQPVAAAVAALPAAPPAAPAPPTTSERLALANYFPWYDGDGWQGCNLCDRPLEPYNSDDPAAIRRHLQQALDVGLDGFTSQWLAVGDRTDRNFAQLLEQSRGTSFRSTIVFSRHMLPDGPTQETLVTALRHVMSTYAPHPNFLRLEGQPVIFVTDVYRVPLAAGQTPQAAWETIRNQVDSERTALWIAEGLDPSYLAVFDGLYVHKITHAAYPDDYVKSPRWAGRVRAWAASSGQRKLWVATISPGWDDTRAACRADLRAPSSPHRRDRQEGAFYRATFASALASQPDWLWVNSFNEWAECTHIEPSAAYGDLYLQLTRELVQQFKSAP